MSDDFWKSRIAEALIYLDQLPPGIDPDPEISETSPEDHTFFIGGIVAKILREAMEGREWPTPATTGSKGE